MPKRQVLLGLVLAAAAAQCGCHPNARSAVGPGEADKLVHEYPLFERGDADFKLPFEPSAAAYDEATGGIIVLSDNDEKPVVYRYRLRGSGSDRVTLQGPLLKVPLQAQAGGGGEAPAV